MTLWIERVYRNCSGCRRCEIACSVHHEGKIWPEASRIRIFMMIPGVEIPHLCFQCEEYPCVAECPTGALSVDDQTGAVNVDVLKCTTCTLCIEACPGRVPHLHPNRNYVVICDLCNGRPRCVEVCQEGRWNTLALVSTEKSVSQGASAKTVQELTNDVAKVILGKDTAREVLE